MFYLDEEKDPNVPKEEDSEDQGDQSAGEEGKPEDEGSQPPAGESAQE